MNIRVGSLVRRDLITVERGVPVIEAVRLMASKNVGSVIITDGGRLFGIITERDVIRALASGGSLLDPVEKVGSVRNLVTVSEDDFISVAAEKMIRHGVRHLIVLSKDGGLSGIVSIRDILGERRILEALSKIY
ncbi:MAG: CBS domain-containing protein [Thermoprotei archaeon]|jgi:CBS domain-containing protein